MTWATSIPVQAAGHVTLAEEWADYTDTLGEVIADAGTYTPTWGVTSGTAPSIGDGTLQGAYKLLTPKFGVCKITAVIGSATSIGSGIYTFSLPSGWSISGTWHWGMAHFYDTSATNDYVGTAWVSDSTHIYVRLHQTGAWSSSNPVAPATGDSMRLTFAGFID